MKNVYLLFIYALVFLASCETNNKKPEPSKYENWAA